jgi:diacylglycerol kinase (ATP)
VKTRFIFNPHSGRNRRRGWLAGVLRDYAAQRGLEADVAITEGPGHATDLAREAVENDCSIVVAVGGDGTMNEVAQALVGTPAALALVPCGSGNGLALHLGLPLGTMAALELAAGGTGRIAAIDTGLANGRPFFNAMGLGLDAEVSRRFNQLTRRGLPAYARVAFSTLRALRAETCTIASGGTRETLDVLLIAIANSDQYGNNARIAPGAHVDDGALDLIAVRPVGLPGACALALRLFLGRFDRSANVRRLSGSRFEISRRSAGLIHTDGETHTTGAVVVVEVVPRSLRMVVPATCPALVAPFVSPALFSP